MLITTFAHSATRRIESTSPMSASISRQVGGGRLDRLQMGPGLLELGPVAPGERPARRWVVPGRGGVPGQVLGGQAAGEPRRAEQDDVVRAISHRPAPGRDASPARVRRRRGRRASTRSARPCARRSARRPRRAPAASRARRRSGARSRAWTAYASSHCSAFIVARAYPEAARRGRSPLGKIPAQSETERQQWESSMTRWRSSPARPAGSAARPRSCSRRRARRC